MAYHRHCSPSRNESNHKDLIVAQLRDEIRELQMRDSEYHDALARLRELEIKMETLQEEKLLLERKRVENEEETGMTIKDLKNEYERAKNSTYDRENELAHLQNEKKKVEDELDSKRISTSKYLKEIEEVKYKNNRNFINLSDLKKNCKRKEEENSHLQQRIDGINTDLAGLNNENNNCEKD